MTNRKFTRTNRRRGVLSFEWILLISVLVIGIIGGLSTVRDAIVSELKDLALCIESICICEEDPDDDPCFCDFTDPNCCIDP